MNHVLKMVLVCLIFVLLVLLLPVFGIKITYILPIVMGIMCAAHLFMMESHGHKHN